MGRVETYSSTTGKRDSRCDSRASTLGKTAYPTRPVSKLYEQEKATKGRTLVLPTRTPWQLGNLFEHPVGITCQTSCV